MELLRVEPFVQRVPGELGMHRYFDPALGKDVVLMDINGGRFFVTMYWNGNEFVIDKLSPPQNSYTGDDGVLLYEDINHDGANEIYFTDLESIVVQLDPTTLRYIDTTAIPSPFSGFSDLTFADPNSDGAFEWYCSGYNGLYVFDAAFGFLYDANVSYNATRILSGNFDASPDIEFALLSNDVVYIVDGNTLTLKNEIDIGFDPDINAYDIDGDGILEVVVLLAGGGVHFIDAVTDQIKAQFPIDNHSVKMWIGDFTANPGDELLVSADFGRVLCYGLSDRELLWDIQIDQNSIFNVVSGDFRGDGYQTLLISEGNQGTGGVDVISLLNAQTGSYLYRYDHLYEPEMLGMYTILGKPQFVFQYEIDTLPTKEGIVGILDYEDLNVTKTTPFEAIVGQHTALTSGTFRSRNDIDLAYGTSPSLLQIFDLKKEIVAQSLSGGPVAQLWALDYDGDTRDELIMTRNDRTVRIYKPDVNGEFAEIYVSMPGLVGGIIANVDLIQADDDVQMELVLHTMTGAYVYDVQTQQMVFDTTFGSSGGTMVDVDVADCNGDGKSDLVMLSKERLFVTDIFSKEVIWTSDLLSQNRIVEVIYREDVTVLVVVGRSIQLFTMNSPSAVWEGEPYFASGVQNLIFHDVDNDGKVNLVAQVPYALIEYEMDAQSSLSVPLSVIKYFPEVDSNFALNGVISLGFNDTLLTVADIEFALNVSSQNNGQIPVIVERGTSTAQFKISAQTGFWPENDSLSLTLSGTLHGYTTAYLDGNNSGAGTGDQFDDFLLSFRTTDFKDTIGPVITPISDHRERLVQGMAYPIRFRVSKATNSGGLIKSVEVSVDSLEGNTSFFVDRPVDLIFDETEEDIVVLIRTEELEIGPHRYILRATDDIGNLGAQYEVAFEVIPDDDGAMRLFGRDLFHTGSVESEHGIPYELAWEYDFECQFCRPRTPIVWNGIAVIAENGIDGSILYMLDLLNSVVLDSFEYESISQPSVFNGQLYYSYETAASTTHITSYDLVSRSENWTRIATAQTSEHNSPHAIEDRVFTQDGRFGGMISIDRWTGEVEWLRKLSAANLWSPIIYNDTVHLIVDGYYFKSTLDGEVLSNERFVSDYEHTFILTANILDTTNNQILWMGGSAIYAVNMHTGQINWMYESFFPDQNPMLKNGFVYFCIGNRVVVLNSLTGEEIRNQVIEGDIQHPPLLLNNYLLIPLTDKIIALDAENLVKVWEVSNSGQLSVWRDQLIVADGNKISIYHVTDQCYRFVQFAETICAHDTLVLGSEGYSVTGFYQDTISHAGGECDTIFQLNLEALAEISLEVFMIGADNGQSNGSITIQVSGGAGGYEYLWSNQSIDSSLSNVSAGNYTLTVTDTIGCIAFFEFNVPLVSSINAVQRRHEPTLYPNPFFGKCNLKFAQEDFGQSALIEIQEMTGKTVFREAQVIDELVILDPQLPAGQYLIRVVFDEWIWTSALVSMK